MARRASSRFMRTTARAAHAPCRATVPLLEQVRQTPAERLSRSTSGHRQSPWRRWRNRHTSGVIGRCRRHTLVFITASLTITHASMRLPYDLARDFTAIAPVATGPLLLVVHPSVPAKSVADLVPLSKAKPNALNYASSGAGSITHLAAELFKSLTGADFTHAHKGTGPAESEMFAGRVQAMFGVLAHALPHVKTGKLHVLAVIQNGKRSFGSLVATTPSRRGLEVFGPRTVLSCRPAVAMSHRRHSNQWRLAVHRIDTPVFASKRHCASFASYRVSATQ